MLIPVLCHDAYQNFIKLKNPCATAQGEESLQPISCDKVQQQSHNKASKKKKCGPKLNEKVNLLWVLTKVQHHVY
jgi:hypothetical protein